VRRLHTQSSPNCSQSPHALLSLKQLIDEAHSREELLSEAQIWSFVADIARGLQHIHSHNLIHLDIKSANIFLDDSGTLKIGDFGLAFQSKEELSDESEGDKVYLAPEVLSGQYGPPCDIFSFGCIVLELATFRPLPSGDTEWQMIRHGDFSSFPMGELSPQLRELIQSLLSPNPEKRPTAAQILQLPACQRAIRVRKTGRSFVLAFASALFGTFRSVFATSLFASALRVVTSPSHMPSLQITAGSGGDSPSGPESPTPTHGYLGSPHSSATPLSPVSPDKRTKSPARNLEWTAAMNDEDNPDLLLCALEDMTDTGRPDTPSPMTARRGRSVSPSPLVLDDDDDDEMLSGLGKSIFDND